MKSKDVRKMEKFIDAAIDEIGDSPLYEKVSGGFMVCGFDVSIQISNFSKEANRCALSHTLNGGDGTGKTGGRK